MHRRLQAANAHARTQRHAGTSGRERFRARLKQRALSHPRRHAHARARAPSYVRARPRARAVCAIGRAARTYRRPPCLGDAGESSCRDRRSRRGPPKIDVFQHGMVSV
eukprot:323421-Pleurochrysis_carterae.AAC.2